MTDHTSPLRQLGAGLARVEAFADRVVRRTRFWGWAALLAAPVIWAIFLRRWVFDSWGMFAAWLPLLALLVVPGLVLLGFAGRIRRLSDLPEKVSAELGAMITEARAGVTEEIDGLKTSGVAGLRALIVSLKDLRGYGDEVRDVVSGVVGTFRLLNPVYLLMVLGAAFGAGLLAIFVVVALLLLWLA